MTTKAGKPKKSEKTTKKTAKEEKASETPVETTVEETTEETTETPQESAPKASTKKATKATKEPESILIACKDYHLVPVAAIKKHKDFKNSRHQSSKNVSDLILTITNDGINTPLTIWEVPCPPTKVGYSKEPVTVQYFVVSGFRRLAAVTRINTSSPGAITHVPAKIFHGDIQEAAKLNLIENVQREDLTPIEICEYLKYLKDLGHKRGEMAEIIGKSPAWVTTAQQFSSKAVDELIEAVKDDVLSYTNAMEISKWEPPEQLRTIEEIRETLKTKGKKEAAKKATKKAGTGREPSAKKRSAKEIEAQLESYKNTPLAAHPLEVKNYYYGIMTALTWVLDKNAPDAGPFWTNIEHVDMKAAHLEETTTVPDPSASSGSSE